MPCPKRKLKPKIRFKVSQTKLSQTLKKLKKPLELTNSSGAFSSCNINIIKQLNTNTFPQPIEWRHNWLEVFKDTITRHNWEAFIRTLRLASQNNTFCGLDNVLRNSFLSILTHKIYMDIKALRLYLYTIAPCRNEHDIEFCIKTILRIFNGDQNKPVQKNGGKTIDSASNSDVIQS
ncbi:AGAP012420-PA [Anopheles gambiae str. PEST]|uniref:AGAP012420-PA n=3 Tax=gambiae species complex TaxID=44542 RepID=Q5TMX3_ANOGA|nr:AGAP012420-PA [Anopheles gambiae str. PEST]